MDHILQMHNISKTFGEVQALRSVDFAVARGEVVGLLGDNGAGKSTLIKILTGVYPLTSGQIYFEGDPVQINSPRDARALGIETCYQDLALVNLAFRAISSWGANWRASSARSTWFFAKKVLTDIRLSGII